MRTVVKINGNLFNFLSLFCWKRWRTVVLAFVGINRERRIVCLSSQLSGRADSSITHCSLSARCWRPRWFDSRWFALVCAAGRCLPSLLPPLFRPLFWRCFFKPISAEEFRSFLRKQDGHPFCRPGELIKRVAAVQRARTLLLISSIRLCRGAAAMFSLLCFLGGRTGLDLFHGSTCCKSVWLREEHDNNTLWTVKCQVSSALGALWVRVGSCFDYTLSFLSCWKGSRASALHCKPAEFFSLF